jgi:pimeloyl-ACP methyl ester carboxylesterase
MASTETPEAARAGDTVVLLHGLWTNRAVMAFIARHLASRGFRPKSIGYLSAMRDLAHNAERVAHAIAASAARRVHVVAHSMGGVVALRALNDRPDPRVRRLVLLGSPIAGCEGGRQMARSRWGARFLGATRPLWLAMPRLDVPAGVEAGAIAGTRRFGLGALMLRLPFPNDGVVAVDETRHPRLVDHLVLPVAHSQMLVSRQVARQVAAFLETGRFAR